jgi:hypothetical protein
MYPTSGLSGAWPAVAPPVPPTSWVEENVSVLLVVGAHLRVSLNLEYQSGRGRDDAGPQLTAAGVVNTARNHGEVVHPGNLPLDGALVQIVGGYGGPWRCGGK